MINTHARVWSVVMHGFVLANTPASASLFTVQDSLTARPGLMSNDLPLNWWDGGPAFTLAGSNAVRINFRGVIVYPATARLRYVLPDARSSPGASTSAADLMPGWFSNPCNISSTSLCVADMGSVFPGSQRGAPRVPDRPVALQVDGWTHLSCASSSDKVLSSIGVYDISACDILDEGLDVFFSHGFVFHRRDAIPSWKYWLLVSLSIVLVRFLSYNVQILWDASTHQDSGALKDQRVPLLCSAIIIIVITLDGDFTYITAADQLFFWCTIAYIAVYICIHLWGSYIGPAWGLSTPHEAPQETDPLAPQESRIRAEETGARAYEQPVYNVIVAALQLVAVRFYSSAETPYNIVILGMLACRGW